MLKKTAVKRLKIINYIHQSNIDENLEKAIIFAKANT